MNKKELVKFLIKNFTNANGNLDLSQLDFSDFDGNISISRMKVKGDLHQDWQKVEGDLYQDCQEVEGNLYQNSQEVEGNLYQDCQEVEGDLHQSWQEVNGDLYQRDQEVKGDLISDLVNVQEFIKEYTFDELNEFIKELQIANNVRGSEND